MGKYMKKSKITSEVSLLEMSSSMAMSGVRTRAKTLALRRLHMSSSCYLELRSRRLHKPHQPPTKPRGQPPRPNQFRGETPDSRPSPGDERDRSSVASSGRINSSCSVAPGSESRAERGASEELESDEQTERRPTSSMTGRLDQGDSVVPGIPTTQEMEEFFASSEQEQQRLIHHCRYNFDVLTDAPLSGRFEWVRVRP